MISAFSVRSNSVCGRSAEPTPISRAVTTSRTAPPITIDAVTGNAARMMLETGVPDA